jgi:hypothetical protein
LSYGHLSEAVAVTDFDPELSIKVQGRELTVTLPGSKYSVTYFKRHGQFGLLAKEIVNEDDPRLPLTAGQFLAKAWKLANEKARELGCDCLASAFRRRSLSKSYAIGPFNCPSLMLFLATA